MPVRQRRLTNGAGILGTLKYGVVFVAVALSLAACSSEPTPEAPYAAEYAAAMAETKSDYVITILEDYKITVAELRDAQSQTETCLSKAGIHAKYVESEFGINNLTTSGNLSSDQELSLSECERKWMGEVGLLYERTITNPNNEDFASLVAQCLIKENLVEPGFTGEDYAEIFSEHSSTEVLQAGQKLILTETFEYYLPSGISIEDPVAAMCSINPSR